MRETPKGEVRVTSVTVSETSSETVQVSLLGRGFLVAINLLQEGGGTGGTTVGVHEVLKALPGPVTEPAKAVGEVVERLTEALVQVFPF